MLKKSTMPLYHQLRELLGEKIESGEWEPGHRLPGENDLTVEFGVSRATVRQAMQLLENQGLVERVQGRGTFVGRPKVAHDLLSLWPTAQGATIAPMHIKRVAPGAGIMSRLELPAGSEVYEIGRIVHMQGGPFMIISSWLPRPLFPDFEERYVSNDPIARQVETYHSLRGFHQHKEVEVAILDDEEAALLESRAGAPALLMTYINRLADGRPFEYRRMIIRGDRCKYYADLDMPEPLL